MLNERKFFVEFDESKNTVVKSDLEILNKTLSKAYVLMKVYNFQ